MLKLEFIQREKVFMRKRDPWRHGSSTWC